MSQVKSRHSGIAKGKERIGFVISSKVLEPILAEATKQRMVTSHFAETLLALGWAEWRRQHRTGNN